VTTRIARAAVLATLSVSLGGCAVISWVTAQFAPPKKVPAVYKAPKGKKVLVFVDDVRRPVSYEPIKRLLTDRLNEQLDEHNIAGETVPYDRLVDVMAATPSFHRLSVSEVGERVDAELVLYVEINRFSLRDDPDSPLWAGTLDTTVRWMEVGQGRLWPRDRPRGQPVKPVELPMVDEPSPTYGQKVASELATKMADRIARLFYDHKIDPVQAEMDERAPSNTGWPDE
jgi:hypothetical protein